jgi:hypothetical protein
MQNASSADEAIPHRNAAPAAAAAAANIHTGALYACHHDPLAIAAPMTREMATTIAANIAASQSLTGVRSHMGDS